MKHTRKAPNPTSAEFTSFQTISGLTSNKSVSPIGSIPHLTGERQRLKQCSQRPKSPWVSRSRPATHLLCCNALIFSYYSHLLEICPDAFFKGNSKKTKPENKKPFILHQTHSCCLGYSNHKLAIHEAHLLRIGFGWVERDVRTSRSSYL